MKKSILTAGLALSLLVGGAGFSSGTVGAAPISEQSINIEQSWKDDDMQAMRLAAIGKAVLKGAAWVGGYLAGDAAARAAFGEDHVEINSNYNYEDIIESFDL